MVVFEIQKLVRKLIDLSPLDRFKYHKNIQFVVKLLVFFVLTITIFSTFMNFVINLKDDIQKSWPSLAPFSGYSALVIVYWYFVTYRKDFYSIFDDMQSIVVERIKFHGSYTLYVETQQRVLFRKKVCASVLLAPIAALSPFALVAYHWLLGKYTIESWFYVYPIWTPFSLDSSWAAALITLLIFANSVCTCTIYFLSINLFVEISAYTEAFIKDIKVIFDQIDRLAIPKRSESMVLKRCKEAIELHNRTYECMNRFTKATHLIILVFVVGFVMMISSSLFVIVKYERERPLMDYQMPILSVLFALQSLFIFFYIGQAVHSDLTGLSDMLYQSQWYGYLCSVRRYMLLMMMRTQQPFHLSAYGVVRCTLDNYLRVLQWIYSAVTLFRNMD